MALECFIVESVFYVSLFFSSTMISLIVCEKVFRGFNK